MASRKVLFQDHLQDFKLINDPIHGHIELHPLLVKIIDTPQFQRLRNLAQLGAAYYVFPGATHRRFEHCIGTSYLAGEFVKTLYNQQTGLGIRERDILCVMIAGLCHDLGHGPFSHSFEKYMERVEKKWKHEESSEQMFDLLLDDNDLKKDFEKYMQKENDEEKAPTFEENRKFIKALIRGTPSKKSGRDEDMDFLYQIVANELNGIDVDKWDYFARDAYNVGLSNNFDHNRLMKFARVLKGEDGKNLICWRDKECGNLYDMFHTRSLLHKRVYQHKTGCAVEFMITDALEKADHLKIVYKDAAGNWQETGISEAVKDMRAFQKLTDQVYYQILYSGHHNLEEARNIIERIEQRKLYKLEYEEKLRKNLDIKEVKDKVKAELSKMSKDFIHQIVTLSYSKGNANPIEDVRFYQKRKRDTAIKLEPEEVLHIRPESYSESSLRIFSRKRKMEDSERDLINKLICLSKTEPAV